MQYRVDGWQDFVCPCCKQSIALLVGTPTPEDSASPMHAAATSSPGFLLYEQANVERYKTFLEQVQPLPAVNASPARD